MKPVQFILPEDGKAWRTLTVQRRAARGPASILLVPGALVLAREVEAIGRTDAQARVATLGRLAPELAMPASDCICALSAPRGGRRMAFVMARNALDDLLAQAGARGHAPDMVVPDIAFMPVPAGDESFVAGDDDVLVRTRTAAFACQSDLLQTLLGGRAAQGIDFDTALALSVREGRHADLPSFMAAGPKGAAGASRRLPLLAGIAAVAALAIFSAMPWIEAAQLDHATAQLSATTMTVAKQALPGAQRIVQPLAQLREAGLPRSQAAERLGNAVTLVEGLSRSPGVAVVRLSFDADAVRAHVGMPATSLLQPLRDHLAASGLHLVETPGQSQPNSIPLELTVTAGPQ